MLKIPDFEAANQEFDYSNLMLPDFKRYKFNLAASSERECAVSAADKGVYVQRVVRLSRSQRRWLSRGEIIGKIYRRLTVILSIFNVVRQS